MPATSGNRTCSNMRCVCVCASAPERTKNQISSAHKREPFSTKAKHCCALARRVDPDNVDHKWACLMEYGRRHGGLQGEPPPPSLHPPRIVPSNTAPCLKQLSACSAKTFLLICSVRPSLHPLRVSVYVPFPADICTVSWRSLHSRKSSWLQNASKTDWKLRIIGNSFFVCTLHKFSLLWALVSHTLMLPHSIRGWSHVRFLQLNERFWGKHFDACRRWLSWTLWNDRVLANPHNRRIFLTADAWNVLPWDSVLGPLESVLKRGAERSFVDRISQTLCSLY